jgi:hypothetical protein
LLSGLFLFFFIIKSGLACYFGIEEALLRMELMDLASFCFKLCGENNVGIYWKVGHDGMVAW